MKIHIFFPFTVMCLIESSEPLDIPESHSNFFLLANEIWIILYNLQHLVTCFSAYQYYYDNFSNHVPF